MKTILGIPGLQVSKKISLHSAHPTVFQQRTFRGLLASLLTLLSLFAFSTSSWATDSTWCYTNNAEPPSTPPTTQGSGPNPGWQQVSGVDGGNGDVTGKVEVHVPNKESRWISRLNGQNKGKIKHWLLQVKGMNLNNAGAVQGLKGQNPQGFNSDNKSSGEAAPIKLNKPPFDGKSIMSFQFDFKPQPKWERAEIRNDTGADIDFTVVESKTTCDYDADTQLAMVDSGMFSYPGSPDQQAITALAYLPLDQDMNTSAQPSWNMPVDTGIWTAFYTNQYDGILAPHGVVVFTCINGPGLQPGEIYNVSFPDTDMHYLKFAYDSVAQEFQEFEIDLLPTLSIASSSNNSLGLEFNSVLNFDYVLQTTPDLLSSNWQVAQPVVGTGGIISLQMPMTNPAAFFRVACQPEPLVTNPLVVIGISAPVNSNEIVIDFSDPVDPVTATDPNNYMAFGPFGQLLIDNVSPLGSRAVLLTLDAPLMPTNGYFLGINGVTDRNGDVIGPITFPFSVEMLQTPCPGGTLLAKQTYSECNPDGFWHVVEDDWYDCPPVTKFRVADTQTTQPCNSAQTSPNPVGLLYCTPADVVTTCQSYTTVGPISVCECVGGLWQASSYNLNRCMDGTLYLDGPIQTVPMNPPTPCGQTPPLSPAPQ